MYTVLTGMATPDMVAMNSGSRPDWAAIITEDCPESQAVSCLFTLLPEDNVLFLCADNHVPDHTLNLGWP